MKCLPDARKESGQSLVEFALGVFLLLLILAGTIDLGRGFHGYLVISNSAREGARYGASYPNRDIVAKVINEAHGSGVILTEDDVYVTVSPKGEPVHVGVHYEFSTLLGGVLGLPKITLNSSVQMMVM